MNPFDLNGPRFLAFALFWVGAHRMSLALQRGHSNVAFLLVSMAVYPLVLALPVFGRRTRVGELVLQDLQGLFSRLREKPLPIGQSGAHGDLSLALGIFGLPTAVGLAAVGQLFAVPGGGGCGGCGG